MSFKSVVKGRGSDRWRERRWWLWWGDMRRMRWTRRTVNRMRLTEWRRKLIPQVRWCISRWARSAVITVPLMNCLVQLCHNNDIWCVSVGHWDIMTIIHLQAPAVELHCTLFQRCRKLTGDFHEASVNRLSPSQWDLACRHTQWHTRPVVCGHLKPC